MKRLAFLFCLCAGLLGGCWDRVEINDVALVTAAAIDWSSPNDIELSIQVFIPRSLSEGSGAGNAMTLIRTAKGVNIADAMSKVQLKIPRKVFWGHCKVYIYGQALARHGLKEYVDYYARHPEPRNRAFVYVSRGQAREVLEMLPPLERYSAEVVRKLSDMNVGLSVTLLDLQKMFAARTEAAALPMIDIMKPPKKGQPKKTSPYLSGTAVFQNGKMIGLLSDRTTRGVLWLRNEVPNTTVTVKLKQEHGFVSLNPIREVTKLTPRIENGKWKMLVNIDTEGDIVQNGTRLTLNNPQQIAMVEEALREDIKTRVRLALKQVQKELKADILNFAQQFHRNYPKEFAAVRADWNQVFSDIEVDINVKAFVRRPGLIAVPGGLPHSEVQH
ncbi:germination protein [Brevibacillus agri]|uniref:Germination protein n=1 Tax=Brevibacillus agri TaxID=51101 RepID=A0A3M8B0A6_9BACL|nr:Ger(x)C family spore germination protein [Brevibacillus agri]QAV13925.1 Ger(x)C family spore germination protein [Brevibacillus agri]RNB56762.1 Ger(x)C family spore germination protein [Brevibacillus agri]GED26290.1 germination protein [Brevibacillus agri]